MVVITRPAGPKYCKLKHRPRDIHGSLAGNVLQEPNLQEHENELRRQMGLTVSDLHVYMCTQDN